MNAHSVGDRGIDPRNYVMIAAAAIAHGQGDLVNEGGFYGFTFSAVNAGEPYRLDIMGVDYYAKKTTKTDTFAVGDIVEYVAPGMGSTTGTVQAHSGGVKFGVVVTASAATEDGVWVMPMPHFYLAHD